ncbi:MAG: hypothetical protein H6Q02_1398 [Acidobacteria bacterium]|nr:hypothetical protein [Acidobacteriota bacterium]
MIVAKIPANRIATSRIGAHEYSLSCRTRLGVVRHEIQASRTSTRSRPMVGSWRCTPSTLTSNPCQRPEMMTAAITPPSSRKLCHPSMRSGSCGASERARTVASSRRQ